MRAGSDSFEATRLAFPRPEGTTRMVRTSRQAIACRLSTPPGLEMQPDNALRSQAAWKCQYNVGGIPRPEKCFVETPSAEPHSSRVEVRSGSGSSQIGATLPAGLHGKGAGRSLTVSVTKFGWERSCSHSRRDLRPRE